MGEHEGWCSYGRVLDWFSLNQSGAQWWVFGQLSGFLTAHSTGNCWHCTALHWLHWLHCTALAELLTTFLHCSAPFYPALHCSTLHITALPCTSLHSTALLTSTGWLSSGPILEYLLRLQLPSPPLYFPSPSYPSQTFSMPFYLKAISETWPLTASSYLPEHL